MTVTVEALLGQWVKVAGGPRAAAYPPRIELREGGAYLAPEGPELGSIWHGGDWRLDQPETLVVQAANDAELRYRVVAFDGRTMTLRDGAGSTFTYRRDSAGGRT